MDKPIKIPVFFADAKNYLLHTGALYKDGSIVRVSTTRDTGIVSTAKLISDSQAFAEQFAIEFAAFYANNLHIYADGGPGTAMIDFKKHYPAPI